jgi:hypothetical protein
MSRNKQIYWSGKTMFWFIIRVAYKNAIYQLSRLDDEFNFIFTGDSQKTVVYSNNGRVYYTECETISSIEILQSFPTCSIYAAVVLQYKYKQTQGYLSRQMIIRLKINKPIKCINSNEEINFGNFDSEFSIYKKGDLQSIAGRNDSTEPLDFEKEFEPLESYDHTFSKPISRMLRDAMIFSIFLLAFLLKLFSQRKFILKKLKMIQILCKKRKIMPTTEQGAIQARQTFMPPIPSAPTAPSFPLTNFISSWEPNVYHSIYNANPSLPLQHKMPLRSASAANVNTYIKQEPYESNGCVQCPHCDPNGPNGPKMCNGQLGLSIHMAKKHNIK